MNRLVKLFILMFFLCSFIYVPNANTATINAASCSRSDVESAIAAASDGDIVIVPSCPDGVSWSSPVMVDKEITIQGQTTGCPDACIDNTLINTTTQLKGPECFDIQADNVRITGFTFSGTGSCLRIRKTIHDFRIDHNKIIHYSKPALFQRGKKYGLFDHNLIEDCKGECFYVKGDGNQAWADGGSGGGYTDGTVYFEDNVFAGGKGNAFDAGAGARVVIRYNTFNEVNGYYGEVIEGHGHFWGERDSNDNAGTYIEEIYGNTFNSGSDRNWGLALKSRGGRVYFYDNTFTGSYWNGGRILFWNKESQTTGGTCNVTDHETLGIHTNPWDGTCENWPCPLQNNNSYVWGNSSGFSVGVRDSGKNHIVEDRDYWDDVGAGDTNFNSGTSRPATCTVDDVYWETDNEKLYRCTSTNTWTFVYEPYTYPHPLTVTAPVPSAPAWKDK